MMRKLLLFPVLLSIYPALNLYATNATTVEPGRGLLPVALIALFMSVATWVISRVVRQSTSAGIIALAFGVFLFYYGYVFKLLLPLLPSEMILIAHAILLIVWIFSFIVIVLNAYRRRRVRPQVNEFLNYAGLIAVIAPLLVALPAIFGGTPTLSPGEARAGTPIATDGLDLDTLPDIYHIILDGYGRQDVLARDFAFDNSAFISALAERGFYIAAQSCANYPMTDLSLSSMLNLDYLDIIAPGVTRPAQLYPLIRQPYVQSFFNDLNYTTIHFATLWSPTRTSPDATIVYKFDNIDPYYQLLLETTLLSPFLLPTIDHPGAVQNQLSLDDQRSVTLGVLDTLTQIPAMPEPTYTFAHLLVPHPPYLFDAAGQMPPYAIGRSGLGDLTRWEPIEGYVAQMQYVNGRILDVIDTILQTSTAPPVIVLQGDHGPQTRQQLDPEIRLPILNAYYLPGGGDTHLYPTISPVNSFRLILDLYFGSAWGQLDDDYYFADYDAPLDLQAAACPQ